MNIQFAAQASQTCYAVFNNGANTPLFYNVLTSAYEAYNAANWTTAKYCVLATETAPRNYVVIVPAGVTAGNVAAYQQLAGSVATTDRIVGGPGSVLDAAGSTAATISTNLDATISSRTKPADTQARVALVDTLTTYTGNTPQTADVGARIPANLVMTAGKVWALDGNGNAIAPAFTAVSNADLTPARAAKLDYLDLESSTINDNAVNAYAAASNALVAAAAAAASAGTAVTQTTAPAIAAAVLDVAQSAHNNPGTIGYDIGQAASGGDSSITITPIQANASNPLYATREIPPIPRGSAPAIVFVVLDGTGTAIDLTGKTVRLVAYLETEAGDDCDPFDNTLTASFKYETGGGGITIGGTDNNNVTVQNSAVKTATAGHYKYFLLNVTDRLVLAGGKYPIKPAVWDT